PRSLPCTRPPLAGACPHAPRHVLSFSVRFAGLLAIALLLGCGPPTQQSSFFSFESSLQGWEPAALAVESGSWSVETTQEKASAGRSSVRISLPQGKLWLQRSFALAPGRNYRARLELALASQD